MTEQIAGVVIPDTSLVADATELVFGSLQGASQGLAVDPELLYVGAMFYCLGLTATYRHNDQRFELDGADEARRFLAARHIPEERIRRVWLGIALRTTPEVPARLEPEVALVTARVELDVLGIGYHNLDRAQIDAVLAAYPRPDFKRQILEAFTEGVKDRSTTTWGTVNADLLAHFVPDRKPPDFVETIQNSAWPE